MSTGWALVLSVLLLAGNAFFVAAEFALVASKAYRLEQAAADGSRGAASALAGVRELSLMLAGAQLGITVCTLGLGALAEPALAHAIEPWLHSLGVPAGMSYGIGFAIALVIVVFLHMVVGEMAPKSWAISHPEQSATLLAIPFRAFTRAARPVLALLNGLANGLLRLVKVTPQDQLAQAHGPEELAILLEQSREHGTLEASQHELLSSILRINRRTLDQLAEPLPELVTVPAGASLTEVEGVCRESGRSRVAVAGAGGAVTGIVHVRDVVRATTLGTGATLAELAVPPFTVDARTNLVDAVALMRDQRVQFALVGGAAGPVGFVALEDLLEEIIGDFEDETDPR